LYACKIKETTNGRWRRARRETRKAFQEIAQRRIETNGEIDERKTTARFRENKTQEVANEKEEPVEKSADGRRIFQLLAAIPARDYRSLWLPTCDKRRDSL
jgi:hypothetical protein